MDKVILIGNNRSGIKNTPSATGIKNNNKSENPPRQNGFSHAVTVSINEGVFMAVYTSASQWPVLHWLLAGRVSFGLNADGF
jgi:hypothetical protein